MKRIIKKLFSATGYKITKTQKRDAISFYADHSNNLGYEFESEANEIIKIVRKQTMLPYINLLTLYEQVRYLEINNIYGDFVECGVWKGGAVALMALTNLKYGINRRKLHLFDAFEEICAPNEDVDGQKAIEEVKNALGDNALIKGELKPLIGIYNRFGGPGNISECKDLINNKIQYPEEFTEFHKGWFQETLPVKSKEIDKIAILRLDGDWYESTKVCIENLYDKVVKGGFIIFDDYGLYTGCKKAVDEFFKARNENYYLHYSTWACRYIQKI